MNTAFEIDFEGKIWNTEYDNGLLCLETKNTSSRTTTFHVLDLKRIELISSFYSPLDNFFCGLDTFKGGKICIHGFDENQTILTKGVSIHTTNGDALFMSDDFLFEAATPTHVILTNKEQQLFTYTPDGPQPLTEPIQLEEETYAILSPIHYTPESEHFATITSFIEQTFNQEAVNGIDYLEFNEHIILSFYVSDTGKLRNLLFILDQEGKLVHKDVLGEQLPGIGIETFFIVNNELYYVRQETTFVGVSFN